MFVYIGTKLTKKFQIHIPVNSNNMHWYVAVINTRKRRIQVLDSLDTGMGRKDLAAMVSN
jgi:Ulp1 family protease